VPDALIGSLFLLAGIVLALAASWALVSTLFGGRPPRR